MDGGEAEAVVTVKRVCMVEPAVPTLRQSMFLSSLDLLFLPFHNIQRLLFYRLTHANDYSSVIENLKNGLSLVLVHFYPLAGQMKISESGRPEVECNNRGVEFKEVSINVPFHDLEKDGFQRKPFFKNLVHEADNSADENYGRPLLSIQVTAFEGGGISIGTTIHHVMVDGNSYWHFMTSWAECSRGISIAKPPQHDRALLKQVGQHGNIWQLECGKNQRVSSEMGGSQKDNRSDKLNIVLYRRYNTGAEKSKWGFELVCCSGGTVLEMCNQSSRGASGRSRLFPGAG
ncbi:hypothetical protein SUGI_0914240 [Cryptomeria japonica]|nr:hypothetical protein SUGI_0914240 [Cryptomeria japonica]